MNTRNSVFLGVDVGTTGAKALVADGAGSILAEYTAEYPVLTPKPLWAEQWPSVWLEGLARAVRGVLEAESVDPSAVAAMTVSSLYGGSGIPVDSSLEPVGPCLIWMDRRARQQAKDVEARIPLDELVSVTGNGVDSYYGFTKILWLRDERPEIWSRTRYLLPPNAYLIHRLTGELAVDHSAAGNIGGVYDLGRRTWSARICELLGIPIDHFPDRLVSSHEVVGTLHADGAELTGLPPGTPVCAGGVDAAVATLSAGVVAPGRNVAMMGTSMCWGFVHRTELKEPGFVSMPYVLDSLDLTYTFGGAATAGALPAWFREHLGGVESAVEAWAGDVGAPSAFAQLDARAADVPPGSEGLLVLPYLMGERSPIWDPDARGTITGMTLYHGRSHLFRACLEGVAYALRHNVEAGIAAGYPLDDVLHVVGGGASSDLWVRIIASVLAMPVVATTGGEAAYGDAMLAAYGVGAVDRQGLGRWLAATGRERRVEPDPAAVGVYNARFRDYVRLYQDLAGLFGAMAERHTEETGGPG